MSNTTKTIRQVEFCKTWEANGYIGTLLATTGFGKTWTGLRAIRGMVKRDLVQTCLIVVPTITLQTQWHAEIKKWKISIPIDVLVINTASKKYKELSYDMIIFDEIHTLPADTFQYASKIPHKYRIGLTATIERSDGRDVGRKFCPVIDEITLQESLDNGWVSEFEVYNIAVPFSTEDEAAYKSADSQFMHLAAILGHGSQAFETAEKWIKDGDKEEQGKAARYYKTLAKRNSLCTNNINKVEVVTRIINHFPDRKALTFCESIKFAKTINFALGDICVPIHSKMTKKQQQKALRVFEDGRTKKRVISSVKALSAGLDVPDLSLGLTIAGNSKKLKATQQRGRIIRAQEGKQAIIINLYTPGTQELYWLKNRDKGIKSHWVANVDEFLKLH